MKNFIRLLAGASALSIALPAHAAYVELSPASVQTGDINISGAADAGSLGITGNSVIGGNLNVSGNASLGSFYATGDSEVVGTLTVDSEIDTTVIQNTSGHSLGIYGASILSGSDLTVAGFGQLDLIAQNGSYITTLDFASPTTSKTVTVPNMNGTVALMQTSGPEVAQSGDLVIGGLTNATGGLEVGTSGTGAAISSFLSVVASESSQSLSGTSGCNSFNISVPGALLGDTVVTSVDQALPGSWTLSGGVSSSGVVTVKACAFDNSTTIPAGNYRVDVWQH